MLSDTKLYQSDRQIEGWGIDGEIMRWRDKYRE